VTKRCPFRYFKTSPEIIGLAMMMYVRFPMSLRNVEDLLHERGIEISNETVRFFWNRFGPMSASEIRRNRISRMRAYSNWQGPLSKNMRRLADNRETCMIRSGEQKKIANGCKKLRKKVVIKLLQCNSSLSNRILFLGGKPNA